MKKIYFSLLLLMMCSASLLFSQAVRTNDLAIVGARIYIGNSGLHLSCAKIPVSQADSTQVFISFRNAGSLAQSGCGVRVALFVSGTLIDSNVIMPATYLMPDSSATGIATFGPAANAEGDYTAVVTVFSDSIDEAPGDNTDTLLFQTSDTVLSSSQSMRLAGRYLLQDSGRYKAIGTLFEVSRADTLTSITVGALWGLEGAVPGTYIYAYIYPARKSGDSLLHGPDPSYAASSILTSADITDTNDAMIKPINLNFDYLLGNPVLSPGLYWIQLNVWSSDPTFALAATTFREASNTYEDTAYYGDPGHLLPVSDSLIPFCTVNFGHPASIFRCRILGVGYLCEYTAYHFRALNNGSDSTKFYWEVDGVQGNLHDTAIGPDLLHTFYFSDSVRICITAIDGRDTAGQCRTYFVHRCTTDISDLNESADIILYPNPAHRIISITSDGEEVKRVRIQDISGRVVYDSWDGRGDIDISAYSSGLYFAEVTTGGGSAVRKFVKE